MVGSARIRRLLSGLAAFWLLSSGCRGAHPSAPLRVEGLESEVISADKPLALRGEQLPIGAVVEVQVSGLMSAVGQDVRQVSASLAGRVLSPESLRVAMSEGLLLRWGRGSFEGELRMSCNLPSGVRLSRLLRPVRFDVDVRDAWASQQHRRRAEQVLSGLGIVISDAQSVLAGLEIADVRAGSRAERVGLDVGDVIERANGVALHALSDLAPGPSVSALRLRVRHPSGRVADVRLLLAGSAPLSDWPTLTLGFVLGVLMWIGLGLLPWRTPGAQLAHWVGALWAPAHDHALWMSVGATALVGAWAAVCAEGLDPFALLILHLGCSVPLWAANVGQRRGVSLHVAGVWCAVVAAAAVGGTRVWGTLVHEQAGGPWMWNVLARPPLGLLWIACALHACRLRVLSEGAASVFDASAARAAQLLCAVLCEGLFFGGALPPGASTASGILLGSCAAALKACLCFLAIEVAARTGAQPGRLFWCVCAVSIGLWSWTTPRRETEVWFGSALCVVIGSWVSVALWQSRALWTRRILFLIMDVLHAVPVQESVRSPSRLGSRRGAGPRAAAGVGRIRQ